MSIKSLMLHAGTKLTKHAPTLLIFGGIGVGVTAAVLAVKKTPKLHTVITEDKETLDRIKKMEDDPSARYVVEQGETDDEPNLYAPYDSDVAAYDRKEVVKHMTAETIRAYALPVGLGLVSISMILIGYKMKCKALIAMTAAYNTTLASFKLASWGIKVVIYANHMLRAAYPAMVKVAQSILAHHRSYEANDLCMPIKQILELIPGTK